MGVKCLMPITHRGYGARIEYSGSDDCYIGHISDISDIVGFHGDSPKEVRAALEEAVDDYIGTCHALNRRPQKP